MAILKRVFILAVLFLMPALAKADSVVFVVMDPTYFDTSGLPIPGGPWGASFMWDTTTQTLSGITLTVGGMAEQLPGVSGYIGDSQFIFTVNFLDQHGDVFQLNYGNHGIVFPQLQSTPGNYRTDLFFDCAQCLGEQQDFAFGEATVTPVDPVSTPEPSTLTLMGAGITALALTISLQKCLA